MKKQNLSKIADNQNNIYSPCKVPFERTIEVLNKNYNPTILKIKVSIKVSIRYKNNNIKMENLF